MSIRQQNKQSIKPRDYKNRIIITGSKSCNNEKQFNQDLVSLVNGYNEDILFITLGNPGPDKWLINWCVENKYPYLLIDCTDNDYDDILKAIKLSSDLIIYTVNDEYPYKIFYDLAKKHKLHISKILVRE